ncbi:kinase-like protein [Ceratobasidium sp. AG-I]|nr:kinase-like protein [Ceratobasidium sp. AG-I]
MLNLLVKHGCTNLSASIDLTQRTSVAIGSGGFGDVWRTELVGGTKVAIKTLRPQFIAHGNKKNTKVSYAAYCNTFRSDQQRWFLQRAAQEMYMWSKLQNHNVQALLGVVVFQGELGVVSPWMELGDLDQYLKDHTNLDKYWLVRRALPLLSVSFHSLVVHGDIKAKNVLVSEDGTLKINDFDHAILADCTLRFTTSDNAGGGTLRWMAKLLLSDSEELEEEGEVTLATRSKESDVYALGMEILTGTVPYAEHRTDMNILRAIDQEQPPRRPAILSGPDSRANPTWELLLKCWERKPSARPDAAMVLASVSYPDC